MDDQEIKWESNRDKKRKPKKGFHYCPCDRAQIGDGQKCPLCGRRDPNKRERMKSR